MGYFTRVSNLAMEISQSTKLTEDEKDTAFEQLLCSVHLNGAFLQAEQGCTAPGVARNLQQQMILEDKMLAVTVAYAGIETQGVGKDDPDFERYAAMTAEERRQEFHAINQEVIMLQEQADEEIEELGEAGWEIYCESIGSLLDKCESKLTAEERKHANQLIDRFVKFASANNINVLAGNAACLTLVRDALERVYATRQSHSAE